MDLLAQETGEFVARIKNFLIQALRVGVFEWQVSIYHREQDNTRAPQVCLRPQILQAFDQLGRCIAWRAAGRGQLLTGLVHIAQAEIDHLEVKLLVEK